MVIVSKYNLIKKCCYFSVLLVVLVIHAALSAKLEINDNKHLIKAAKAASVVIGTSNSNNIYYFETKNNTISYDSLIQLCTVLGIIYIEEGNRKRRLGDLRTAKRYYQMAIRLQNYISQALIYIHNP